MKKKFLAATLVIAGALVLPTMAAQDTSGMRYTSASEGFYASLRVQFNSGGTDDTGAGIENSTSRFGVQGTNDLGNGLQGFYQYESEVEIYNGGELETRLAHVGLRGGFGQLQVGSFWPQSYNWVHGSTDVANWASGSFIHTMLLPGRQSRALEYTTPDISGFQVAVFIEMDPSRDGEGALVAAEPDTLSTTIIPAIDPIFRLSTDDADIITVADEYRDPTTTAERRTELRTRIFVQQFAPGFNGGTGEGNPRDTDYRAISANPFGIRDSDVPIRVVGRVRTYYYFDSLPRNGGFGNDDPLIWQVSVIATPGVPESSTTTGVPGDPGNPKDDNDIDLWSLSSKYALQGFNAGVSYTVAPDALAKSSGSRKDLALYALRLGYAQDNWYVSSWYAEDNAGDDTNRDHDTETFSLAAGVAVGKANLYALYETQESDNYTPEIPAGGGGYPDTRRRQHGHT